MELNYQTHFNLVGVQLQRDVINNQLVRDKNIERKKTRIKEGTVKEFVV